MHEDHDPIARILKKLELAKQADPDFEVFGAKSHRYIVNLPASTDTVLYFEKRYGVALPDAYKRFILEVANGGPKRSAAGPFYGIFGQCAGGCSCEGDSRAIALQRERPVAAIRRTPPRQRARHFNRCPGQGGRRKQQQRACPPRCAAVRNEGLTRRQGGIRLCKEGAARSVRACRRLARIPAAWLTFVQGNGGPRVVAEPDVHAVPGRQGPQRKQSTPHGAARRNVGLR